MSIVYTYPAISAFTFITRALPHPTFVGSSLRREPNERFCSTKLTAKFQFIVECGLHKRYLRCHPRTKRSGVKDLAQAPTARPDVYLFLKSYFCITKIRFITPTVRRSFTPCKALRLRMTSAESARLEVLGIPPGETMIYYRTRSTL